MNFNIQRRGETTKNTNLLETRSMRECIEKMLCILIQFMEIESFVEFNQAKK